MRNYFMSVTVSMLLVPFVSWGQSSDDIMGLWMNEKGNRKIEIYKDGGYYYGKIVWVSGDTQNAKVNDIVLRQLSFNNKRWSGQVYIPSQGSEYNVQVRMSGHDLLRITASEGIFSRTKEWTRTKP